MSKKNSLVRILMVEDSPVCGELLKYVLELNPRNKVVGWVYRGEDVMRSIEKYKPDLISMDINLPGINGYETTRRILSTYPVPVVIISGKQQDDVKLASLRAMEAGAVAVMSKPPGPNHPLFSKRAMEIAEKVTMLSGVRVVRRIKTKAFTGKEPSLSSNTPLDSCKVVAIGASTGGPQVIQSILSSLDRDFPLPVLVCQHIGEEFTDSLVDWLDNSSALKVKKAEANEPLLTGTVYVNPGSHLMSLNNQKQLILRHFSDSRSTNQMVESLFFSVNQSFGRHSLAILLTGMGIDGAQALKNLKESGARTIIQSEETCVVYGMPGEAFRLDSGHQSLNPHQIISLLRKIRRN